MKTLPLIFAATASTALICAVFTLSNLSRSAEPMMQLQDARNSLPQLYKVPSFTLTAQNGSVFDVASLNGKVWVANFIFTRCHGPCPLMSQKMASLQRAFSEESRIRYVSFTTDPEFDSPEILEKYAIQQRADQKTWTFLTGQKENIDPLITNGFKLGAGDDPSQHSTRFVLVDEHGWIRGYYDSSDSESISKLKADAKMLLTDLQRKES